MPLLIKVMLIYYGVVNVVLFILMGVDKVKAKRNEWRIREATLFVTALVGGGIGGFLGMRLFHHKTKKWYFYVMFAVGVVLHTILLWCAYSKL
ncbi:hypothetical protein SDC9_96389 [bioreactor metagenome]|uniref:DUF1294 domain-containing protein n=1 Tax=bioreactor metagenome TaxID=1076179 RepID=A0A645A903_9ZZZZ|nr:DUF1294 domain-containing protein [Candidatus Metalachnospira sp.]